MSSAALELLKGGATPKLEETPMEEQATVVETEEEVDIEKLKTHKQIDTVVKDYELETPVGWDTMTVAVKKKYLNDTYGDTTEESTEGAEDSEASPVAMVKGAETGASNAAAEHKEGVVLEEAPKKVAKAKSPAKAVAKTEDNPKEVPNDVAPDTFHKTISEIETMSRETALSTVSQLNEESNFAMFRLGGILARIQEEGWFDPYNTFHEFVETEHGLAKRKALYWISIYKSLVAANISFGKVAHIGWSKLKEIAPILNDDNSDHWIEVAENSTVTNLIEKVKAHKKNEKTKSEGGVVGDEDTPKELFTRTFKLFEDQVATVASAIDKMKDAQSLESDAVALEYICLQYLGTPTQNS